MSSFNNPDHADEAFKAAQLRFRKSGVGGIVFDGDKSGKDEPVDPEKVFKEARSRMKKDKRNNVTLGNQGDKNKRTTSVKAFSLNIDKESNNDK